jgi:hypothetical protein
MAKTGFAYMATALMDGAAARACAGPAKERPIAAARQGADPIFRRSIADQSSGKRSSARAVEVEFPPAVAKPDRVKPTARPIETRLHARGKNAWGWTVYEVGGRKLDGGVTKGSRETAEQAARDAKSRAEASRKPG